LLGFVLKKVVYGLSVLLGVVTLVFFLFNTNPDRSVQMLAGQFADEATITNIKHELRLDLPKWKQYTLFINDLSPIAVHSQETGTHNYLPSSHPQLKLLEVGEKTMVLKPPFLRFSYQSKKPVSDIIAETLPNTFVLAFTSIGFATVLGIILGVYVATIRGSFADQVILFISVLGMAAPSFFAAILLSCLGGYYFRDAIPISVIALFLSGALFLLLAVYTHLSHKKFWQWMLPRFLGFTALILFADLTVFQSFGLGDVVYMGGTGLQMTGSLYSLDTFAGEVFTPKNLILPTLTLGVRPLAVVIQLTRNSVLEEIGKDYVVFAQMKGLSSRKVLFKHVLPNALNPVVTALSGWFASLLAGAVFVEFIFGWRGLGLEVYDALQKEDLPVVMGAVLLFSSVFVCVNIFVDIIYGVLDPRIRLRS